MRILVTGGAGFIGSNFILHMFRKHPRIQIVNLDKLTYAGNLNNLVSIRGRAGYKFVKGDIASVRDVRKALSGGVDAVVNFAAESHVDRSILGPAEFVRTNTFGTQVILEQARRAGVGRFVQISTDEVYGSLPLKGKSRFTEKSQLSPSSPYSASKASADLLARAYFHTFGFPTVVTRCSNNYGPFQFPEKFLPLFITNAMEDKELPLYGDGRNVRDWIHVEDHCRAIEEVLLRGAPGEVYNIGGDSEMSNIDMAHLILDGLGKPRSLIRFVKDRPGHDRRYAIDAAKIGRELGWTPSVTLKDGVASLIHWYKTHRKWWQEIKSGAYTSYYRSWYGERLG